MGELLGLPEWLAVSLYLTVALSAWLTYSYWSIRRAHTRLALRRANPDEETFLKLMMTDCSDEAARFVWDQAHFYVKPRLTPHPDDDLLADLKIDEDDLMLDWPREWAERKGFHESNFPDWPQAWPATVRNFAKWLDLAPV